MVCRDLGRTGIQFSMACKYWLFVLLPDLHFLAM
jgi:hypothetical protein